MKYTSILVAKDNAVLTITMNRPEKMNACNLEMFSEIDQALTDAEDDEDVKVIVITGAGENQTGSVSVGDMIKKVILFSRIIGGDGEK